MTEPILVFDPNVPREVHKSLTRHLKPLLPLLRTEIRRLVIQLKDASDDFDGEAATMSMRRYHWASISLSASFFTLDEEQQARTLAHECVHILHDTYAREVAHLVIHLVPEDLRTYISWRLEDAEERVVDALGDTIWEMTRR